MRGNVFQLHALLLCFLWWVANTAGESTAQLSDFNGLRFISYAPTPTENQFYSSTSLGGFPVNDALGNTSPKLIGVAVSVEHQFIRMDAEMDLSSLSLPEPPYSVSWGVGLNLSLTTNTSLALLRGTSRPRATTQKLPSSAPSAAKAACTTGGATCTAPINTVISINVEWNAFLGEPALAVAAWSWLSNRWMDVSAEAGCTGAATVHQGNNSLYSIPTGSNMTEHYVEGAQMVVHCRADALLLTAGQRSMLGTQAALSIAASVDAILSSSSAQDRVTTSSQWGAERLSGVVVPSLHEYVQLVAMRSSTCALYVGGKVRCWGLNQNGRLGLPATFGDIGDDELPSSVPTVDLGSARAAYLAGLNTVCVVTYELDVLCWGDNGSGNLGRGDIIDSHVPVLVGLSAGALRVAVGPFHSCALLVGGSVQCWGSGVHGKLGYNSTTSIGSSQSVSASGFGVVPLAMTVVDLTVGNGHTCALYSSHQVACWGEGANGALGYGSTDNVADDPSRALGSVTVPLPSGQGYPVQVVAQSDSTCVLFSEGTVSCWGDSASGQTGMGSTNKWGSTGVTRPSDRGTLSLGGVAVHLAAGSDHVCATLLRGKLQCWGLNGNGQLGVGDLENVGADSDRLPSDVGPLRLADYALSVTAGGFHTCWVERGGAGRCIGRGTLGRLGYGNTEDIGDDEDSLGAQRLQDYLADDVDAAGIGAPSCPILTTETQTWLVKIVPGISHTCLLYASGSMRCFGSNKEGRLGLGKAGDIGLDRLPYSAPEIEVGGKVVDISANLGTCVLVLGGTVSCWGHGDHGINGYGSTIALGLEQTPAQLGPVPVSPDARTVTSISRGGENVCVIMDDGKVRCWGRGAVGNNGQGNTNDYGDTPSSLPNAATDLDFGSEVAVKLAVGRIHSCFVMQTGAVYCIGSFLDGRHGMNQNVNSIGNNEPANHEGPVPIDGHPGVTVVDVGCVNAHTCVLRSDSKIQCWGSNEYGQLALKNDDASNIGDAANENGNGNVAPLPLNVVQIAVAFSHTCVLYDDGTVACFGSGGFGRLGYGDEDNFGLSSSDDFSRRVPLHDTVISLSTESLGTCVIYQRGAHSCWGSGFNGRLGTGNQNRIGDDETPADIPPLVGTPSDLFMPWSSLKYKSVSEAACPGSFKALLNPRIIRLPPSARTTALETVPGWFSSLVSVASGLDAPDLPAGSALLCAQMQASVLLLQPSEPGARSRTNRAFCRWPSDWADAAKVSVSRITARDGDTPIQIATTGGDTIMLHGRLWPFALVSEIGLPAVTIGTRACTQVTIVSIERLTCVAPPLSVSTGGGNVTIQVVHSIPNEATPVQGDTNATYSSPRLIAADPPIDLLFTGQPVLLIGQFLGDVALESGTSQLPLSAVNVELFDSLTAGSRVASCAVTRFWDSGVRCEVPPRLLHGLRRVFAEVVVANQISNRRAQLTYAIPSITALEPSFVLTPDLGPQPHSFEVVGTFFGATTSSVRIFVGPKLCDDSTRLSAFRARCRFDDSAPLRSLGQRVTVTIDIDNSNTSAAGALRVYGQLTLTPIAPQTLPRDGRDIVLSGSEFGRFPSSDPALSSQADIVSVTLGPSADVECSSIQVTGDSLSCTIPPGLGSLSPVRISRVNGSTQQVAAELSYAAASITRVSPSTVLHAPSTSNDNITLVFTGTGFDFATPSGPPPSITGTVAGAACSGIGMVVHNASSMSCIMHARQLQTSTNPITSIKLLQEGLPVAVQSTVAFTVTSAPVVSAVQPSVIPAPGNIRITLIGAGFGAGRPGDIASVVISAAPCSAVLVVDSFSLSCIAPAANAALGAGTQTVADVILSTASGAVYIFPGGLSYSRPEILTVSGGQLQVHPPSSTATTSIVAGGLNLFDGTGGATAFKIGNISCEDLGGTLTLAASGRSGECSGVRLGLLPQLEPGDSSLSFIEITTALGQYARTAEGSVRITGPPLIGLLSPARAAEGERITIAGNNLGRTSQELTGVTIGSTVLNASQFRWTSSSSIVVDALPPATGTVADVPVSVTVAAGYTSTTEEQQGVTYVVPVTAPTRPPGSTCGYRDASGSARVAFVWRDDATTSSNGVAEWQLSVLTDLSAVSNSSSGLVASQRRIPGDEGTTNPGHLLTLPAVCRDVLSSELKSNRRQLQGVQSEPELIDVRITDAPSRPFWVRSAAATQNDQSVVLAGPESAVSNSIFSMCANTEYLSTQFARVDDFSGILCRECPSGAQCNGQPFEAITNAPGFMAAPWDASGLSFIPCSIADTCSPAPVRRYTAASLTYLTAVAASSSSALAVGASSALPQAAFDLVQTTANSTDSVSPFAACQEGHTGPACGVCIDGFANQGDGRCAKCAPRTTIIGALIGGTLIAMAVIAYLIYSTVAAAGQPAQTYVAMNKLLLTHLQQISLASVFPMQWPGYILSMFEAFETTSSVSDSLISVECLQLDPVSQFRGGAITTLSIPIFALAFCACLWFCMVPLYRRWRAKQPSSDADDSQLSSAGQAASVTDLEQEADSKAIVGKSTKPLPYQLTLSEGMIVSAIVVAFLLHLSLAEASLGLLTCRDIDGQSLLAADLTVDCNDPSNRAWMLGIGLPGFIVYGLGIPAAAFGLLYWNREILFQTRGKALYGFLVSSLEPEWYFWESVVQWRKVLLTVVATLMEPLGLGLRVTTSMVLLSLFMAAHLLAMPYEAIILDKFEAASSVVTLTTLAAGSTLVDDTVSRTSKVVVSILVVVVNAILLATMVGTLILEALRDPVIQESLKMVGITVPQALLRGGGADTETTDETDETDSPIEAQLVALDDKPLSGPSKVVSSGAAQDFVDDSLPVSDNPIASNRRRGAAAASSPPAAHGRIAFG